jgi:acyl-CoA thioester hydrolase
MMADETWRLSGGVYLPTGEFMARQPVRAYEPAANGRLGMGNLLRYCELIANMASAARGFTPQWYAERGETWVIFRQTIELVAPAHLGDTLDLMTWVHSYTRVSAQRHYRVTNATTGAVIARAETTWAYVDRARQSPKRVPPELLAGVPVVPRPSLIPRVHWGQPVGEALPPTQVEWWARGYEADSLQHINNCVYADWLTEAARLSCATWSAANPTLPTTWLPRRLTLHYQRSALAGDIITIATQPERLGPRGIVLSQTIAHRDDPAAPLVSATAWYLADRAAQVGE